MTLNSRGEVDLLARKLRQLAKAGEISASAICYSCRVDLPEAKDALAMAVNLERFDGERVQVFLPIIEHGREVAFGEIGANDMAPQVFIRS